MKNTVSIAKSLISTARSGWMLRGVPRYLAESIAEHSFLSSYICLDIGSRINVNLGKLILYTIVHDIGEAFTGDIVKVFSSEVGDRKKVIELRLVEEGIDSDTIKKLYISYTNQDDVESKVAKLCNYIATYVKGLEYKSLGFDVADIIDGVEKEIEKASKELGIDDTIKNIVQKYIKK